MYKRILGACRKVNVRSLARYVGGLVSTGVAGALIGSKAAMVTGVVAGAVVALSDPVVRPTNERADDPQ
jgi:hypothetical protein